MRILGIDPGIGRTGWGVIRSEKGKLSPVSYGCIEPPKTLSVKNRLQEVYTQIVKLIKEEKPDCMAIEELFLNTNVTTALVVGQARGVIFLAAAQHSLPIGVYTPPQVKMATAGYGRADKKQVGHNSSFAKYSEARRYCRCLSNCDYACIFCEDSTLVTLVGR